METFPIDVYLKIKVKSKGFESRKAYLAGVQTAISLVHVLVHAGVRYFFRDHWSSFWIHSQRESPANVIESMQKQFPDGAPWLSVDLIAQQDQKFQWPYEYNRGAMDTAEELFAVYRYLDDHFSFEEAIEAFEDYLTDLLTKLKRLEM